MQRIGIDMGSLRSGGAFWCASCCGGGPSPPSPTCRPKCWPSFPPLIAPNPHPSPVPTRDTPPVARIAVPGRPGGGQWVGRGPARAVAPAAAGAGHRLLSVFRRGFRRAAGVLGARGRVVGAGARPGSPADPPLLLVLDDRLCRK